MSKYLDMSDDEFLAALDGIVSKLEEENQLKEKYLRLPLPDPNKWHQVGVVSVDSGQIWLGDPSYVLMLPHNLESKIPQLVKEKSLSKTLGKDWCEFADKVHPKLLFGKDFYQHHIKLGQQRTQDATQFNHEHGAPGLGVCVGSGHGDGTYPVKVKYNSKGLISEVRVVFIEDNDEFSDIEIVQDDSI